MSEIPLDEAARKLGLSSDQLSDLATQLRLDLHPASEGPKTLQETDLLFALIRDLRARTTSGQKPGNPIFDRLTTISAVVSAIVAAIALLLTSHQVSQTSLSMKRTADAQAAANQYQIESSIAAAAGAFKTNPAQLELQMAVALDLHKADAFPDPYWRNVLCFVCPALPKEVDKLPLSNKICRRYNSDWNGKCPQ